MKKENYEHVCQSGPRAPQLNKIDDSKRGRFPKTSGGQWVPGLVEVKFRSSSDSGVKPNEFSESLERAGISKRWPNEFSNILTMNQLVAWRPSFNLTYPWSTETKEEARAFFLASGRDKFVTLRFPNGADVSSIAKKLEALPQIRLARPVARLAPPSPIDEPLLGTSDQVNVLAGGFESQWYARRCNLPQALERATGRDVIIADIDWGFNEFHQEYISHIALKKNVFRNNDSIAEGNTIDHGTAVLGLAGARDNGLGMIGFAPDSILWAIQAGHDQVINHDNWRAALDFVRTKRSPKRKVIILEIQTTTGGNIEAIPTVNKAIRDAKAANIVVCVPAGNSTGNAGRDDNNLDIEETGSVLVGATSFGLQNIVCSKEGPRIVVYAPGDPHHDLTCSIPSNFYRNEFGGTSGAVAKVAGAVALMLQANPTLTPTEVKEILGYSQTRVFNASGNDVGVLLDCEMVLDEVFDRMNAAADFQPV